MTEDEAFIRAIVDSPGDDTPRLVYADWLDEVDDSRGAYLRAEHEWWRTRRKKKAVLELAAALDPMWVARVSRPALGICCDHLALSATDRHAQPADLDAAAESLDVTLPPQLRALLLNYNLGLLRGGPFVMPDGSEGTEVDAFACLDDPEWTDGMVSHELADRTHWIREEYGLEREFVYLASTLADDTDFVVSCRSSDHGAVYLMDGYQMLDDPDDGLTHVAESIGAFLAALQPKTWPLTDV